MKVVLRDGTSIKCKRVDVGTDFLIVDYRKRISLADVDRIIARNAEAYNRLP